MKNKILFIIAAAIAALCIAACVDGGRHNWEDDSIPAPEKVTIKTIESTPGGARILYELPNDNNLAAVKVVYERNGVTCENMTSRYRDTLVIEGYGDVNEHQANIYSVGINGKLSDPTPISFSPLTPSVLATKVELLETFGGVSVSLSNNTGKDALAAVLLRNGDLAEDGKDVSEIDWEEFYTFHTSSEEIMLSRRGLSPVPMLYGVYLRDRWYNISDTIYTQLTPIEEIKLPRSTWQNMRLPTDSYEPAEGLYSWYDFSHLWDNDWHGDHGAWASTIGPRQIWFTIDLGYTAKLSRMQMFHRLYEVYSGSGVRHFQVWGSTDPSRNGAWDDSWFLLGDFMPLKPSGYTEDGSVGTVTIEDIEYWNNTCEFVFEETEDVPNPYRECRYLRFKLLDTFNTYGLEADYDVRNQYVIGEIILYGQMPNADERNQYYN